MIAMDDEVYFSMSDAVYGCEYFNQALLRIFQDLRCSPNHWQYAARRLIDSAAFAGARVRSQKLLHVPAVLPILKTALDRFRFDHRLRGSNNSWNRTSTVQECFTFSIKNDILVRR